MGGSTATALFFLTLLPLDALQVDVAGGLDARERTFVKDKPCVALGHRHCPLGERVARLRSQRVDPSSWPSSCLEYWIWDGSPVRGPRRSRGMALGRKAPGWCAALGPSTSCVHPWASSGDLQCSSWWSRAYPRRRWLIGHLQWPATTPRSWRSWVDRSRKSVAMRRQANLPRPMEVVVEIDPAETSETRGSSLGGEALGEETATGAAAFLWKWSTSES